MAKKDKNEDDYKNENFDNSEDQNDEDFGLPDLDDEDKSESGSEADQEEDKTEEEESSYPADQEPEEEPPFYGAEQDEPYEEQIAYEEEAIHSSYEPPKKTSMAPIFITLGIILLLALAAVYFIFIRTPEPEKEVTKVPVKDTTSYVVEKPIEIEEPEIEEPKEPETGEVNILSSRTGRSYVVVGSFFDPDMAKDYADDLTEKGYNVYIIPPFGSSKFNRVAIAESQSFSEANAKATELADEFKEQPWPLKY